MSKAPKSMLNLAPLPSKKTLAQLAFGDPVQRSQENFAQATPLDASMGEGSSPSCKAIRVEEVASMDFSQALEYLKKGSRLHRIGWNGKGMWVGLFKPTNVSDMTLPFLYMRTAQGTLVPWTISHTDVMGDDWAILSDREAGVDLVDNRRDYRKSMGAD